MSEVPKSVVAALFCAGFLVVSAMAIVEVPMGASALPPHSPIVIHGDGDFTAANGVTQGDGSEANPYVIEGWAIDTSYSPGIEVRDVTAYFVIRDVSVVGSYWQGWCILVVNATHAVVQDVTVSNAGVGVRVQSCNGAVARGITAKFVISGVQLLWCDSCVVLESSFQSNDRGVEIYTSTHAMVFSNTFSGGGVSIVGSYGQDLTYNSHIIASNNTVNGRPLLCYTFQDGLDLSSVDVGQLIVLSCSNVKMSGLSFGRGFDGIMLALCDGVEIADCSFVASGLGCMSCRNVTVSFNSGDDGSSLNFYQCRNVLVHGNVLDHSYYMGVQLHNCWNVTASSNTITGMDLSYGIYTTSDDVTITGNVLTGCGIDGNIRGGNGLTISPDNTVNGKPVLFYQGESDVVIDSVPVGQLLIGSCDRVWVANISVSDTCCGISIDGVSDITVFHTRLSGNAVGLSTLDCSDLKVLYNRFEGSEYYGALIQYTTNCLVYGNTYADNDLGLDLWMSDGIMVYRNIFSKNTQQADENGCTDVNWDDGYPEGGNYWSDYSGIDQYSGPSQDMPGSDGFGDTSYSIGANGLDRYPFMSPPNITIPEPPSSGINATIDFEPNTLNLKRMGQWVTVYISLPSGYDVNDIVLDSVVLNGRFPASGGWGIGDFDKDKQQELMVKFDWRKSLRLDDSLATESVTMTVSGLLKDGTAFQGSAEVAIVHPDYQGSAHSYTIEESGTASIVALTATVFVLLLSGLFVRSRRCHAQ